MTLNGFADDMGNCNGELGVDPCQLAWQVNEIGGLMRESPLPVRPLPACPAGESDWKAANQSNPLRRRCRDAFP